MNKNNFRNRMISFMQGRNGFDMLSKDLVTLSIILMFLNLFVRNRVLTSLTWLPIIVSYIRAFSKDTYKRYQENIWYYEKIRKHLNFKAKDRSFRYFKCPNCKQKMRAPRGKGKIKVKCHNCSHEFIKRV